jgi:peptidyl-prolyl cis-trans isomerase C
MGMMNKLWRLLLFGIMVFLTGACSIMKSATPTPTVIPTATATITPIPSPTPTPQPVVAYVNGIGITSEDFDTVRENFREALTEINGSEPDAETLKETTFDWFLGELLFESAATKNGITVSDEDIESRLNKAIENAGGEKGFAIWLSNHHYTREGFIRTLRREAAAVGMRQLLIDQTLVNVEQIYAYMIRTDTHPEANQIKTKLDMGLNFVQLAKSNDPVTGGDLDWVARGVMIDPVLEEALFALEPGSYTDIIETENGFFLLYAAQRSTEQPLSLQTRQILEKNLLRSWVEQQKTQAEISFTDLY